MLVCPNGHDSASEDFCDVCGMRIGVPGTPGTPGTREAVQASSGPTPDPASTGEPCPRCGTAKSGQFCEACGFNFGTGLSAPTGPSVSPTKPAITSSAVSVVWTAVVSSDRDYYESVRAASDPDAAGPFPDYCAERQFRLVGSHMRIGRRSVTRDLEPEIDLADPPADPGISRLHAVLIAARDGTWAVLDPGSANGTLLNGREIGIGDLATLHDGDRINLGAWTAITVHRG
jgi:hypothetical protein